MRPHGMFPLDPTTPSLLHHEPLLDKGRAPAGTLFVLGADGGYAATPAPANRLVLGRNSEDVHVTVGAGDWYVSREHATLHGDRDGESFRWRLRNDGRLPILMQDQPALLHEQEVALPYGYFALHIRGSRRHVVEVRISDGKSIPPQERSEKETRDMSWHLGDRERLVLVAMFQDYLFRTDDAHPLSWKETSQQLNEVPGQRGKWNKRKAENAVDGLRHKLAKAGHDGILANSAHPDKIKLNLLRFLLETGTLVPTDLRLLETGIGGKEKK